jgi:hypothetical protein
MDLNKTAFKIHVGGREGKTKQGKDNYKELY